VGLFLPTRLSSPTKYDRGAPPALRKGLAVIGDLEVGSEPPKEALWRKRAAFP
jgi:hypothetical protein